MEAAVLLASVELLLVDRAAITLARREGFRLEPHASLRVDSLADLRMAGLGYFETAILRKA